MGNVVIIPWGCNICPSNVFNNVADVSIFGELRAFKHDIDIMLIKALSSITIQRIFFPSFSF
jgi:hypothetical protein